MTCKSQNTVVAPAKGETVKYQGATSQDPLSKALANFLGLGLGAVFPYRRSPGRAGDGDGGQEVNSPREMMRGWRGWHGQDRESWVLARVPPLYCLT